MPLPCDSLSFSKKNGSDDERQIKRPPARMEEMRRLSSSAYQRRTVLLVARRPCWKRQARVQSRRDFFFGGSENRMKEVSAYLFYGSFGDKPGPWSLGLRLWRSKFFLCVSFTGTVIRVREERRRACVYGEQPRERPSDRLEDSFRQSPSRLSGLAGSYPSGALVKPCDWGPF